MRRATEINAVKGRRNFVSCLVESNHEILIGVQLMRDFLTFGEITCELFLDSFSAASLPNKIAVTFHFHIKFLR